MQKLKMRFPEQSVKELDHLIKNTKEIRIFRRAQAVRDVVKGHRMRVVSDNLNYSYSALHKWVYRFSQNGVKGLFDQSRPGRPKKITPELESMVQQISQEPPQKYGYPNKRWSCQLIVQIVQEKSGVELSRESIRRILI